MKSGIPNTCVRAWEGDERESWGGGVIVLKLKALDCWNTARCAHSCGIKRKKELGF